MVMTMLCISASCHEPNGNDYVCFLSNDLGLLPPVVLASLLRVVVKNPAEAVLLSSSETQSHPPEVTFTGVLRLSSAIRQSTHSTHTKCMLVKMVRCTGKVSCSHTVLQMTTPHRALQLQLLCCKLELCVLLSYNVHVGCNLFCTSLS